MNVLDIMELVRVTVYYAVWAIVGYGFGGMGRDA